MRQVPSVVATCMAALMLAGCLIPIPITAGYLGTRENVGERVPAFIEPGETTREDVLMALGEPDAVAVDESWLTYGSAYLRGGLTVVIVAGPGLAGVGSETIRYRRLLVRFDSAGIVTGTGFESMDCQEYAGGMDGGYGRTKPCIDLGSADVSGRYGLPIKRERQSSVRFGSNAKQVVDDPEMIDKLGFLNSSPVTRAQVEARLGAPSRSYEDGVVASYDLHYVEREGGKLTTFSSLARSERHYMLMIEYDDGIVTRRELFSTD